MFPHVMPIHQSFPHLSSHWLHFQPPAYIKFAISGVNLTLQNSELTDQKYGWLRVNLRFTLLVQNFIILYSKHNVEATHSYFEIEKLRQKLKTSC